MNYLIIGGASGIGKPIMQKLLEEGHDVYTTYNQKPIDIVHSNLFTQHYNALNEFNDDFLPDELNAVVYCPGKIDLKPFHRIKTESFIEDFQIQVLGAVNVIRKCLPKLKKVSKSSVLLFSTVATKVGFNFHAQVAVSKGAIEGLAISMAAELAPNIRVNVIAPSITNTPLASSFLNSEQKVKANEERHPLKTIGAPEDIADLAHFLISNKAKWITGQSITVDGGISSIIK